MIGTALCGASYLSAQSTQLSLGVDVGVPFGEMTDDGASLILGPTLGLEFPVGKVGITAQGGYSLVFMKDDARYTGWNMIPAHLGLKYYFSEPQLGWYAHLQGGIHSMIREFGEETTTVITVNDNGTPNDPSDDTETSTSATLPSVGITSTLFSYALGIGYQSERMDVSVRYQGIGADDEDGLQVTIPGAGNEHFTYPSSAAYNYIGIRIAYLFNLGGDRAGNDTP